MYNLEIIILTNLTKDENFTRKVLPFIRADYFEDQDNVFVFLAIKDYIEKYNKTPGMGGVYDEELMSEYIGMGMKFILSGSDLSFMMNSAKQRSQNLRSFLKINN